MVGGGCHLKAFLCGRGGLALGRRCVCYISMRG